MLAAAQEKAILVTGPSPDPAALKAAGAVRVCLGHEFCERLLPEAGGLTQALRAAAAAGTAVTLLTPPLSPGGIRAAAALLREAASTAPRGFEVVFNDWGTARLLAEFPAVPATLGRLLSSRYAFCGSFPEPFLDAVTAARASAVELDPGAGNGDFARQLRSRGLKVHLHWPFACRSVTRFCQAPSANGRSAPESICGCALECAKTSAMVRYPALSTDLLARGNAWLEKMPGEPGGEASDRVIDNSEYGRTAW
ncbi:MAG: hypothetical protein NDI60_03925 [Elusimicrobiales bacterium]|nr:hypothetical protein [Elusimicrobiales bacterium]